jgi:hypothetical protein
MSPNGDYILGLRKDPNSNSSEVWVSNNYGLSWIINSGIQQSFLNKEITSIKISRDTKNQCLVYLSETLQNEEDPNSIITGYVVSASFDTGISWADQGVESLLPIKSPFVSQELMSVASEEDGVLLKSYKNDPSGIQTPFNNDLVYTKYNQDIYGEKLFRNPVWFYQNTMFLTTPTVLGVPILKQGDALASLPSNVVLTNGNQTIGGTKTFSIRPSVNGTGVLLSGEATRLPDTIVYTTGDQIIAGTKTFNAKNYLFSGVNLNLSESDIQMSQNTNLILDTSTNGSGVSLIISGVSYPIQKVLILKINNTGYKIPLF